MHTKSLRALRARSILSDPLDCSKSWVGISPGTTKAPARCGPLRWNKSWCTEGPKFCVGRNGRFGRGTRTPFIYRYIYIYVY